MLKKVECLVICFMFVLSWNLQAKAPKVSGNFERGSRYALPYEEVEYASWWFEEIEEIDQESWAYDFRKGYLQLAQKVNKNFRYAVKYNFIHKDFFAATTNNKNMINYYRTYSWIGLPHNLNLKLEYYIRHQEYTIRPWDNLTHVPNLLLKWKPDKKRSADLSVKFKAQRYEETTEADKDKNQFDTFIGYKEKISDRLTLNAKYKYTFRHYTDNPTEKNAVKKSISAGFEYQF